MHCPVLQCAGPQICRSFILVSRFFTSTGRYLVCTDFAGRPCGCHVLRVRFAVGEQEPPVLRFGGGRQAGQVHAEWLQRGRGSIGSRSFLLCFQTAQNRPKSEPFPALLDGGALQGVRAPEWFGCLWGPHPCRPLDLGGGPVPGQTDPRGITCRP